MTVDHWMNLFGIAGVSAFLFSYWAPTRGVIGARNMLLRMLRWGGFALLLTPLLLRWYMMESLLFACGLLLAVVGAYSHYVVGRRRH